MVRHVGPRRQQLSTDLLHAPELSSKPAARRCCCRSTGQRDGQTKTRRDRQPTVTQTLIAYYINKAVVDRRLRPRCCHLESYIKRPISSPVRLQLALLHTFYSQAQGCVCTALQLGGDVEQSWLTSKYDVIHKAKVHNVSLRSQKTTEPWP